MKYIWRKHRKSSHANLWHAFSPDSSYPHINKCGRRFREKDPLVMEFTPVTNEPIVEGMKLCWPCLKVVENEPR